MSLALLWHCNTIFTGRFKFWSFHNCCSWRVSPCPSMDIVCFLYAVINVVKSIWSEMLCRWNLLHEVNTDKTTMLRFVLILTMHACMGVKYIQLLWFTWVACYNTLSFMQGYLLLHTMRHRKPLLPQMGLKPCVQIQVNIEVWYVGGCRTEMARALWHPRQHRE